MRTVTLGSLGAVAPVVPALPPQMYGLGETPPFVATVRSREFWAGVGFGALAGAAVAWWLKG